LQSLTIPVWIGEGVEITVAVVEVVERAEIVDICNVVAVEATVVTGPVVANT
jgi:hypothetical protein